LPSRCSIWPTLKASWAGAPSGAQAQRGINLESLVQSFVADFPEDAEHAALWHDVHDAGDGFELMPVPPEPSSYDDEKLLAFYEHNALSDPWEAQAVLDAEARQAERQNSYEPSEERLQRDIVVTDRLAEIRGVMQTDPGAYWGEPGKAMRDEYEVLTETMTGEGGLQK